MPVPESAAAPTLPRRAFLGALALPVLLPDGASGGAIVVVLVRHAEKGGGDPKDPDLSPEGRERAALLSRMLAAAPPTHLYSSPYQRTRATLEPLAGRTSLEVASYAAADAPGLAGRLKALPSGSIAVVAAHSNTLPAIARSLGAELGHLAPDGCLREDEYDRFVVVVLPAGSGPAAPGAASPATLDLRYGS